MGSNRCAPLAVGARGCGLRTGNQFGFAVVALPYPADAHRCTALYATLGCCVIALERTTCLRQHAWHISCNLTVLIRWTQRNENNSSCHSSCQVCFAMTLNRSNSLDSFAGAMYTNSSNVSIRGNTSFSHNSAKEFGGENGEETNWVETGFPKGRTQILIFNHALKDEAATACLRCFPQDCCQRSSCWRHLLSASTLFVFQDFRLRKYRNFRMGIGNQITGWFRLNAQNCVSGNSSRRFFELDHEILHTYSGRQYLKLEEVFFFIWGFAVEISGF